MSADEPTTETLRLEQIARERTERERAEETPLEDEERKATRRADKAAYLRAKLEQQAANPDEVPEPDEPPSR